MLRQTHVIDICLFRAGIRQKNRVIPETETVDSVVALRHAEERLSVIPLDARHQIIFSVQLDRSGVHHGVDAETLHKVRIGVRV